MKEALDRVIFGFHCVDVADDEVVFLHETWKRVRLLRPETSETSETFPPARKGRDFHDDHTPSWVELAGAICRSRHQLDGITEKTHEDHADPPPPPPHSAVVPP